MDKSWISWLLQTELGALSARSERYCRYKYHKFTIALGSLARPILEVGWDDLFE